jgi:hypothetical protein
VKNHAGTPEFYKRLMFEQVRLGCLHPKTKKPIFTVMDQDTLMAEHNGAIIEELSEIVREVSLLNGEVTKQAKKKLQIIQNSSDTTSSLNGSTVNG